MQANFVNAGVAGSCVINVRHGKETLEFNGNAFQGVFRNSTFEPFDQLNRYWKRLDPELQDRLFQLMIEAKEIFNEIPTVAQLIQRLDPIVNDIVNMHDTNEFERWVRHHGEIWIPSDMATEYTFNHERPGSREQTYLVPDYWELAIELLLVRTIVPIIGEFVDATKAQSGAVFRDLNAYYLIKKTSIDTSPAMERLKAYVAKNVKKDVDNTRSFINGIGSDMLQTNLIATIIIRALSVASMTKEPTNTNLIQIAFRALGNKQSQSDSHQNKVSPKDNPNENDDSEDSSSRAEKYKNKAPIPPGEITALEKYTEYTHEIAARLLLKNELTKEESDALDEILDRFIGIEVDADRRLSEMTMEECQIELIRQVTNPIIPARAYWDIGRSSVMRMACVAQFVLWQTGFKDLAGIVTARSMNADGFGGYSNESRAQIPKALVEKLNELYPFYRRHPVKKAVKADNEVLKAICNHSDELRAHTWFLNMSNEQLHEVRGSSSNKTYRLGYETRIRLAEYAIYVQQRNASFISLYNF